jgi:hypothetical protein
VVESTALEMRRAREGTQGSNPCLSANASPANIGPGSRALLCRESDWTALRRNQISMPLRFTEESPVLPRHAAQKTA